jgi:hypothetical protein
MRLRIGVGVVCSSLQQNTQQGRTQCTNSDTQPHRRDLDIDNEREQFHYKKKMITFDDVHIGQNM